MTYKTNADNVPDGTEILTGPRGSKYYLRKGKKVYLNKRVSTLSTYKYTAPHGAFARYLAHQLPFD